MTNYDAWYDVAFSLRYGVSPYLHHETPDDLPPATPEELAWLEAREAACMAAWVCVAREGTDPHKERALEWQ